MTFKNVELSESARRRAANAGFPDTAEKLSLLTEKLERYHSCGGYSTHALYAIRQIEPVRVDLAQELNEARTFIAQFKQMTITFHSSTRPTVDPEGEAIDEHGVSHSDGQTVERGNTKYIPLVQVDLDHGFISGALFNSNLIRKYKTLDALQKFFFVAAFATFAPLFFISFSLSPVVIGLVLGFGVSITAACFLGAKIKQYPITVQELSWSITLEKFSKMVDSAEKEIEKALQKIEFSLPKPKSSASS